MTLSTIRSRRGTAAQWTSANPILALGEFGYETDTNKLKLGDGATVWSSLTYVTGSGGGGSVATDTHAASSKTTPADADELALVDSAASFVLKKLTWANAKATLKAYLDSTGIAKLTTARTINGVSFDGTANIAPTLNQVAVPTTDVSLNSHKITNLATPTSTTDAANQAYVDGEVAPKLDASALAGAVEVAFPHMILMVVYSAGWAVDPTLQLDAAIAWHFVGGDDANPPPTVSGPAVWDEPV